MKHSVVGLAAAMMALAGLASAQAGPVPIDVERSAITIHVGKAGLLSAAGHDHWIAAPIASGIIEESPNPHVEFRVETAKMFVKPDPKVDGKAEAAIQKDLEEMTLETTKFPEIAFHSTRVDKVGDGQWKVTGELALHGVTKTVEIMANRSGESYAAHTVLKQTDFGIKPISIAGGSIKVKNEIELDFQILPRKE
jgi:polyisoprenoid-binding protein YceI